MQDVALLTDQDNEDGAITSDKIADGTIANVDVSSTAAIDGTKISPDFLLAQNKFAI